MKREKLMGLNFKIVINELKFVTKNSHSDKKRGNHTVLMKTQAVWENSFSFFFNPSSIWVSCLKFFFI